MRLGVFTLESLANAAAVRRFVTEHAADIAVVALSNPFRRSAGGAIGQTLRHVRRSGPRILPFLAANFTIPAIAGSLRRLFPRWPPPEKMRLRDICRHKRIEVLSVDGLQSEVIRNKLRSLDLDLILSFHFDQIFDAETLALARWGGINVHPSVLPKHRGPVPTFYALLETPPVLGVTIHRLASKIDAGEIFAQRKIALPAGISALTAARHLHEEGRLLLDEVLADLRDGRAAPRHVEPLSYRPFPSPGLIREARKKGLLLADLRDIWAAFKTAF